MGGKAKKDRDVSKENADSSGELRVVILPMQGELVMYVGKLLTIRYQKKLVGCVLEFYGILRDCW